MATLLSTLKLVTATRATQTSPAIQRRQKLIAKIDEQICLATAAMDGTEFKPTKFKNVVNAETGETEYKQVAKKVRAWYWKNDAGKWNLVVRYGARIIELSKGKNSIELLSEADVIPTLELLKTIISNGELDEAITSVSKVVELKLD
jgi:hypothetical protein